MPRVTEKKRIDIDHTCVSNPVFLNWLNTKGGREVWLFKYSQNRSLQVSVTGTYEPYQDNIEKSQGFIRDLGRESTPRLTVGSKVPINKLYGLEKILESINVLMLMNPFTWATDPGGPRWQIVRIIPGTFKLNDTDEKFHTIEFTIELPFRNIQAV